jgi:hypothetical protein
MTRTNTIVMGKLVVRPDVLMSRAGVDNSHRLAMKSRVSAPSMGRWIKRPEKLQIIYLEVLYSVLRFGWGLTHKEILNVRLGDLFEIVDIPQEPIPSNGHGKK